jgi:molybdate transport system permease protein
VTRPRDRIRGTRRLHAEHALLAAVGGLLVVFLAFPLVGLLASTTWRELLAGLGHPLVWPALRLSLLTTSTSLLVIVVLGTPLAWTLSRHRGRFAEVVETLVQLPIVIPPAVAGVAMLLAFGRRGLLAGWLYPHGWSVTFTTAAVVMAEVFVAAPFYLQAATSAFRRMDPTLVVVARTFGASPLRIFFRLAVPMAAPGLTAGALMAWARSLGEFGATLMFAGNLQGTTQTLPLAIYTALEADLRAAQALSIVLIVVAFCLLLGVRAASRSAERRSEGAP